MHHRLDLNTVVPETYVFQCGKPVNKRQRHDFIESYMAEEEAGRMKNVWILKPSGGGKGKGIEVVRIAHCSSRPTPLPDRSAAKLDVIPPPRVRRISHCSSPPLRP